MDRGPCFPLGNLGPRFLFDLLDVHSLQQCRSNWHFVLAGLVPHPNRLPATPVPIPSPTTRPPFCPPPPHYSLLFPHFCFFDISRHSVVRTMRLKRHGPTQPCRCPARSTGRALWHSGKASVGITARSRAGAVQASLLPGCQILRFVCIVPTSALRHRPGLMA